MASRPLKREPHQESLRDGGPPELFQVKRGLGTLGAWALPSETISIVSMVAMLVFLVIVFATEATRFFFRLSFSPAWFSISAAALTFLIAWRGSSRPGPRLPRIWALCLTALNVVFSLAALAVLLLRARSPEFLRDPFPLHGLALAGAVGAVVLLPRLYPMHPLKSLVQTIAPISLGVVLCISILPVVLFMRSQMAAERDTLVNMASNFRRITKRLLQAAEYPYSDPGLLRNPRSRRDELDAVLSILRESPRQLSLPDATRWKAAGILERDGQLKPAGDLLNAANSLIDAVYRVFAADQIPEIRSGRYLAYGQAPEKYFLADDEAKRKGEPLPFAPGASIGSTYFPGAAKWIKHIEPLAQYDTAGHYQAVMAEVPARLERFSSRVSTAWSADLLDPNERSSPQMRLSELFDKPLGQATRKPLGDLNYWSGLTWSAFLKTARDTRCRIIRSRPFNDRLIDAPPERLTQEQRESGRKFYSGVTYDWEGAGQCFAFNASVGAAPAPIVVELRLQFEIKDKVLQGGSLCGGRCWVLHAPGEATVQAVDLFVEIPPERAGQSTYLNEVWEAYRSSVERVNSVTIQPVQPPAESLQGPQKMVRVRVK